MWIFVVHRIHWVFIKVIKCEQKIRESQKYFKCLLWQFRQDWGPLQVSDLRKLSRSLLNATLPNFLCSPKCLLRRLVKKAFQLNMNFMISKYLYGFKEKFRYFYPKIFSYCSQFRSAILYTYNQPTNFWTNQIPSDSLVRAFLIPFMSWHEGKFRDLKV